MEGRLLLSLANDEGCSLLQPSPDLLSKTSHCTNNTATVSSTVSYNLSVPHFRPELWAALDLRLISFPRMKHRQPTQRGCVGRQEGTRAHSTCDMDQLRASRRLVCVNSTYFSMVIVRNCWNIKGYIAVFLL